MKILLVQYYRGISIGEIEIEHINNERYFYYYFKTGELKNELEPNGTVLLVQFKDKSKEKEKEKENEKENTESRIKQCCAMALGEYKELKIDSRSSEKGLLKIENIKPIKFNKDKSEIEESQKYKDVIEIIEQINSEVLNNVTHNLIEIEINDNKYNELRQLVDDNESTLEEEVIKPNILKSYDKFESHLRKSAQRSIYAKRVENKGDRRENRTEYQRDWERIIHSKAFRRLEDKAQIYTLSKGDHFRTRLTHTLEVTQIARGIARELDLNEDLVEAIALAHDLGHTPFGHVGERTLHKILEEENVEGGFKHNFQGVKVVNYLEEKYGDFEGVDLTYQVMEGILKHTRICSCEKKKNCQKGKKECLSCHENLYKIGKFLSKGDINKLHPEYSFSTTLEGQAVEVADEIAQRAHDLDDGIASGIISEEDFLNKLKEEPILTKLNEKINDSLKHIKNDKREYIDTLDIKRARIVSDVITYFIGEIVQESKSRIDKYEKGMGDMTNLKELVIQKRLIGFDVDGKGKSKIEEVRNKLEELTSHEIINSEEVNCFDGKGKYIIRKLYKAYKTNPRQMSRTTLKRISREISRYANDVVDIISDNRDLVDKELEIYNKKDNVDELDILKHKIFIRCIVDLISGMTDDFANKQFEKLYSPRTY